MKFPFSRLILLIPFWLCTSCSVNSPYYCFSSPEPKLISVSIVDRNGMSETISSEDRLKKFENIDFLSNQPYEKVLQIYARDNDGNIKAYVNSYHPNGQPKEYLEVINSRAFGSYKEWHPNGVLKLEAKVIGGEPDINASSTNTWLFDGQAQAWNESGDLIADINYAKGKLEGDSFYYHNNGNIWKKINYSNNLIEGSSDIFLENGMLLQSTKYENGQKHGSTVRYWECGRIAAKEEYENGKLISGIYYDLDANLVSEVCNGNGFRAVFGKETVTELNEFRNGIQEGKNIIYGPDKLVIRTYHTKNGIKHGEEIEYFEFPASRHIPRISISWFENKIQGPVKTWYDDGTPESQREMSNNKKNGIATGWYRDGSLMLLEEYEQGKIVKGEYFRRRDRIPITTIDSGEGTATLFDAEGNFIRKVNYRNGAPLG
jgi:antitoxin component YwqK of YwqJK toxin-antitoxin module